MRNITQFLLMLTLSFYIAFAPAVAYADEVTDKIAKLQIDLQKRVGDSWTLSPRNKSVGAGVEIGATQSYPVTATTTATTAAGATTSNTATLTAEKIGSKIFTPTTARVAKAIGTGVAANLITIAIIDLLGKAVDYVQDPAKNRVLYAPDDAWYSSDVFLSNDYVEACKIALKNRGQPFHHAAFRKGNNTVVECFYSQYEWGVAISKNLKPLSYDDIANKSVNLANNGNTAAQSGLQTVVNDMITKNEIDSSYFDAGTNISNDTYNDVTNNYVTNNITNQYPSVSVPSQSEMAAAAQQGQSSVTKTTQNANGSTTTTTTNFNTTNNTTNNNTTTNNTYNITNITVNNPAAAKDDSPASAPASTTTPTASTPASTPKPTDSKPFELPAFCDWAKPVCDFIEWFKKDPEKEDPQQPGVVPIPTPTDTVDIAFGGSCPAPKVVPWYLGGHNVDVTIPYTPICDTATLLNPLIKLAASLGAVFIVAGIRRGDDG